jgi:hypothetical protein
VDGAASGWTAAAAALGALLLDPARAPLPLAAAALTAPLLGCDFAYGGEALDSPSSFGGGAAAATAGEPLSPLRFGELLLLDLRGCFPAPHHASASTLSPPPQAPLGGEDDTDGSRRGVGGGGSGPPVAADEGGGAFLAWQRGAVFVGLRLASVAVACLRASDEEGPGAGGDEGGGDEAAPAEAKASNDAAAPTVGGFPSGAGGTAAAPTAATTNPAAQTAAMGAAAGAPSHPVEALPKPVSTRSRGLLFGICPNLLTFGFPFLSLNIFGCALNRSR